ncbi:sugar kinase [Radiobacillus kanasensis]|uniref:sugar kinase n=1 Tax=Radiobacillus kanasensis TaxID=2844358 RepID=UPI001E556955|nr:sugar kinase [Radiobacillus kanasensis]UFU00681.1 sugar kinase [Radiobacillus kanasensis]
MLDVITIGDAMITFNPTSKGPMRFVHSFERRVGGAELNLAIGCARLGLRTGWISRLGNDEFGKHILHFARGEGMDTSQVKLVDGYPTSVYFKEILEDGTGRNFYYRDNSPTITMSPEALNESYIKQAKLLHITGVFSAIDERNPAILLRAMELAKKHGVLVSLDPNIRLKLWSKEKARSTMESYLPFVDILLTGDEEANILFGTSEDEEIIHICKENGIDTLAIKKGEKGASAFHQGKYLQASPIPAKKVVDTVGAGDGFNAGFLYGMLNGLSLERTMKLATTIGSMVVSVSGDNEGLPFMEDVLTHMGEKELIER